MQRPQATSGQGESLVRLKLQPHFFASGLSGLAGTAKLREEQPGSPAPRAPCSWTLGTCQGLCTRAAAIPLFSHPNYLGSKQLIQTLGCFQSCLWAQGTEPTGTLGDPTALPAAEDS